jgi:adenosylcobyric acid synthase
MTARALAVFGTGSDVGKSIVATALCRIARDAGIDVAPFKAQNMSNNAGAGRGGEMGRAQIVQAQAAGVEAHVDMNPVLLKPHSETGSQVVVLGQVLGNREATAYFHDTSHLRKVAFDALDRIRSQRELVILEGAGSCAEVNLRTRDFVNFDAAHHADAPVILVADIHPGGVFGQVVGTLACLDERDRARVEAVVINRFRGDIALFRDGVAWLEARTGVPVLGVLPWLRNLDVESEDGLPPEVPIDPPVAPRGDRVRVGVLRPPHIANFTDVAPFARRPEVDLQFLVRPRPLAAYDLVILPGSKNTRGDLRWLRETGWERELKAFEGRIVGICGGYQALGRSVADPGGVEGEAGETAGLGLLDVDTVMGTRKRVGGSSGRLHLGPEVQGYEIHVGRTPAGERPAVLLADGSPDGAVSEDGRVWGCYLHGVFDEPAALHAELSRCRPDLDLSAVPSAPSPVAVREEAYDRLADHVRAHTRAELLGRLLGVGDALRGGGD